ncbi:MAG TPA: class D sortase [Gemmatimonadaceae bacterium]|nr:class D sortase [Gemmatimonadaceae bacterium]
MSRRALGYALFCIGGLTSAFAGGRYVTGAWQQQEARRAWEHSEAQAIVALARRASMIDAFNGGPIVPGAPVARLTIPRLGVDEIVLEGVDDYSLNGGPGHLPGSVFPGEKGNSIISAHRDRHFAPLGEIRVGDTVVTESGANSTKWVVISKRVIDADAPALFHTQDATLTLTTCWPIRYLGTAPERLLVTAKPIAPRGGRKIPSFVTTDAT